MILNTLQNHFRKNFIELPLITSMDEWLKRLNSCCNSWNGALISSLCMETKIFCTDVLIIQSNGALLFFEWITEANRSNG